MAALQLLLFPELEKSDIELLREELDKLRESCDKVRKGHYARLSETTKMVLDLKHELETLKNAMLSCKSQQENGQWVYRQLEQKAP